MAFTKKNLHFKKKFVKIHWRRGRREDCAQLPLKALQQFAVQSYFSSTFTVLFKFGCLTKFLALNISYLSPPTKACELQSSAWWGSECVYIRVLPFGKIVKITSYVKEFVKTNKKIENYQDSISVKIKWTRQLISARCEVIQWFDGRFVFSKISFDFDLTVTSYANAGRGSY